MSLSLPTCFFDVCPLGIKNMLTGMDKLGKNFIYRVQQIDKTKLYDINTYISHYKTTQLCPQFLDSMVKRYKEKGVEYPHVTAGFNNKMVKLLLETIKGQKIICVFDWGTLSVIEGFAEDADIEEEGIIEFLTGNAIPIKEDRGLNRFELLKYMFEQLHLKEIPVFVLTNNAYCYTNREKFVKLIQKLIKGFTAPYLVCSNEEKFDALLYNPIYFNLVKSSILPENNAIFDKFKSNMYKTLGSFSNTDFRKNGILDIRGGYLYGMVHNFEYTDLFEEQNFDTEIFKPLNTKCFDEKKSPILHLTIGFVYNLLYTKCHCFAKNISLDQCTKLIKLIDDKLSEPPPGEKFVFTEFRSHKYYPLWKFAIYPFLHKEHLGKLSGYIGQCFSNNSSGVLNYVDGTSATIYPGFIIPYPHVFKNCPKNFPPSSQVIYKDVDVDVTFELIGRKLMRNSRPGGPIESKQDMFVEKRAEIGTHAYFASIDIDFILDIFKGMYGSNPKDDEKVIGLFQKFFYTKAILLADHIPEGFDKDMCIIHAFRNKKRCKNIIAVLFTHIRSIMQSQKLRISISDLVYYIYCFLGDLSKYYTDYIILVWINRVLRESISAQEGIMIGDGMEYDIMTVDTIQGIKLDQTSGFISCPDGIVERFYTCLGEIFREEYKLSLPVKQIMINKLYTLNRGYQIVRLSDFLTDPDDIDILNDFIKQNYTDIPPAKYAIWKDAVLEVFGKFVETTTNEQVDNKNVPVFVLKEEPLLKKPRLPTIPEGDERDSQFKHKNFQKKPSPSQKRKNINIMKSLRKKSAQKNKNVNSVKSVKSVKNVKSVKRRVKNVKSVKRSVKKNKNVKSHRKG